MNYSELDLAILKAILTNKKQALDFTNECSINLFQSNLWNFSNIVVGYIKLYHELPTLKILKEKLTKTNPAFLDTFENIWKKIEEIKVDEKEYINNIEKIKNRFSGEEIEKLNEKLKDYSDIEKSLASIEKTVRNIKSLTTTKTYERKTLKDSIDPFKEEINAKLLDPNFDAGVLTGYSFIDNATDGLRSGSYY